MKICIELDEKMEEMWKTVKRNLESELRYLMGYLFPSLIISCSWASWWMGK